jgi:predicted MFS family arabinose efflux permease
LLAALAVAVAGTAFVMWELRLLRTGGSPLLDVTLVRHRAFGIGLLLCLLFFGTQVPFYVVLSQAAQRGAGLDPLSSALLYAALGLAFLVTSVLAGRADARRRRLLDVLTIGGLLLMAGSYIGLRYVPMDSVRPGSPVVTCLLALNGVGAGLVAPTLIRYVLSGVAPAVAGLASGLLATAQQTANSVGVVLAGAIFEAGQGGRDVRAGFRTALLYFLLLAVAGAVASATLAATRRVRDGTVREVR